MADAIVVVLFVALVLDWYFGEPEFLWSRMPHPVMLFGKCVSLVDQYLNHAEDSDMMQYRKGSLAVIALLLVALTVAVLLQYLIFGLGWLGGALEVFLVFALLAQKSLYDHVADVKRGLLENGVEGGREAVALIVGRDPDRLDRAGVSRAAIESLAENFSDGVVAPAFWYVVFGLPGLLVYKMINTADSMIAYKSRKYLWFGRTAAIIDDAANWLPARFSAFVIAGGTVAVCGISAALHSLKIAYRDAGLHRSPNAGWPEAAMAGGTGLALGGPRVYAHETVQQAWINATGKRALDAVEIGLALKVFERSCQVLWAVVLAMLLF